MKLRSLLMLSILAIATTCLHEEGNVLKDIGVVQGKTSFISSTSNQCILALKYSIKSNAFGGGLLPQHLFYVDTSGFIAGPSGNSILKCETIETRQISEPLSPVSIFLLMDKSVTSINEDFNLDHLIPFKEAFFRNITRKDLHLEVNFGMCASNNPTVPKLQIIYENFQSDILRISADSIAPIFNLALNGGKSNLPESMDSVLDYITEHSHYSNRVLFLFTDDQSGVSEISYANDIAVKARKFNTRIVVYSTLAPDFVLYSQRKYVNGSDGFQFNCLPFELTWTSTYRNMDTLFDIFENGEMYESTVRLTASENFFSANDYGTIKLYVPIFNGVRNVITPLYER